MRHGRLASALALVAFTGLAAGQAPTTEFAADREPAATAPGPILPAVLGIPTAQTQEKAPPTTDKAPTLPDRDAPKPIPPSAAGSSAGTTPPTISAVPPGGVILPPDGGTVFFGNAVPVDPTRWWVSAEYLRWKIKKDQVPPLVATGPASFPVAFLGNPGTTILFAGDVDPGTLSGVRLRAGLWLDACHTCGLEASGFWLREKDHTTTFGSGQFPVLARPFTDVNPGGPNSEFLAFPGLSTGAATVRDTTQFCGATVAARCPLWNECWGSIDGLAGLQYLNLKEELTVVETALGSPNNPFPGAANTRFVVTDTFKTRNQFYGAFVGVDGRTTYGCWTFDLTASLGAGCNRQTVEISGSQVATPPGGTATVTTGGLLAVPGANIGRFSRNEFSVVPQVGLNVGYQLTDNIQVFGGYTCLYWTNVVRPGGQIDPVLDVNRIPNFGGGPAATSNRPVVPFADSTFWAHGVSAGVRLSW